jgi:hypothetical protein
MQGKAKHIFRSPTLRFPDTAENTHCFKENLKRRDARRNYAVGLQDISNALIASGCTSLDKQAKALGLNRSTAWTIVKTKHKLGRLHTKTTARILANPDTPASVRTVIQQYIAERLASKEQIVHLV